MTGKQFSNITLIAIVLVLGFLNYRIMKPFLIPVTWALLLTILFYPLYDYLLKYIKRPSVTSLLTLSVILLIIVGPFSYCSFLLIKELGTLLDDVEGGKFHAFKTMLGHPGIQTGIEKMTSLLNITPGELDRLIAENISQLGKGLVARITRGLGEVITVAFRFIVVAISIFFFLKHGSTILGKVYDYLPFSVMQKDRLARQVRNMIISTLYGGVIVATVQGAVGGLAFFIVGIQAPILWGSIMAIASFLPLIGPFVVWFPAAIYLLIQGEIVKGVGLVLIGTFVISLIDTFLRPMIIGNRTQMPFLALFFSVLGGISLFGFIGFILGPMLLALFVSVIEIFKSTEEMNQAGDLP
ncbi:AI-2E family transporter [bacterium]|nr:AI-2E family transporter [bacterium]